MFIGEYQHVIDEKGRVAVPVKFRTVLAKGAVVTKGLDNCLFLYPKAQWQALADKIAALPPFKANTRALARLMLAGAMDVDVDKQGRMLVPEYLRQFAGLKKKVIVAGVYDRLELWDEATWHKYKAGTEGRSSDIAEALGDLNLS